MAIVPKTAYGAQTESNDPGYPYGKARNNGTPGDGTGTPLEALWVNDFFGFCQSLLAAAGIIPSEAPDKVGASQYLASVLKLIENGLVALTGRENLWTADNFFVETANFLGIANLNVTRLKAAEEILYTAPKQRRVLVPVTNFFPVGSLLAPESEWKIEVGFSGPQWSIPPGGDGNLLGFLALPAGATVTEVRVYTTSGAGSDLGIIVARLSYDTEAPLASPFVNLIGDDPVQVPGTSGVLSTGPVSETFGGRDLLRVGITAGTIANYSTMHWAEVIYTEYRATGSG